MALSGTQRRHEKWQRRVCSLMSWFKRNESYARVPMRRLLSNVINSRLFGSTQPIAPLKMEQRTSLLQRAEKSLTMHLSLQPETFLSSHSSH